MGLADAIKWLDNARPGSKVVYHIGNLFLDGRDEVANFLYEAAVDDRVWLFQRRLEVGVFEYMAIKKGPHGAGRGLARLVAQASPPGALAVG